MARPRQPIPRYISPDFYIPEGLIDLQYEPRPDIIDEEPFDDGETLGNPDENDFVESFDEPDDAADVPQYFTVVEQIARFAPDGTRVVDVIIEVEDIIGITKYDVRKTKTA